VARSPGLARLIAEAGHELGNHGGWHGMASKMSRDDVRKLILDGEQAIAQVTGRRPALFAPPAGDHNAQTQL
jgi:peptidoglycan/xylan/chitin deacetylase (PgdA/CDA1 family)